MDKRVSEFIKQKTKELSEKFPIEAAYNSRCSLWQKGVSDGLICHELFVAASEYYGGLWNYVGD